MKASFNIWLIGAGPMAIEYAYVLNSLECEYTVIGRGASSASVFYEKTGVEVHKGGLEKFAEDYQGTIPDHAIVALPVELLSEACLKLLEMGVKNILVEKPGGLYLSEIDRLMDSAIRKDARVCLGYNRRFFESVIKARELIEEDGGCVTLHAEFTEWSHVIKDLEKASDVKGRWLIANSSHVLDLAFFLGGLPLGGEFLVSGQSGLDWHESGSAFAGSARTDTGCLFTYSSNWRGPGRWRIELTTKNCRYLLSPLEELSVMKAGQLDFKKLQLPESDHHKPGLFKQVNEFFEQSGSCLDLQDYRSEFSIFEKIAGYL